MVRKNTMYKHKYKNKYCTYTMKGIYIKREI